MPRDIVTRMAAMADADALAQGNVAMAWETERTRLDPATVGRGVRTVLEDPRHGFYVVATCGGEVVGSLLVTFEWSDWRSGLIWWVQSLYVQPEFRRRGVLRALHDFVRTKAVQERNVCGIRLYVEQSNHAAQRAYQSLGMWQTRYVVYEKLF